MDKNLIGEIMKSASITVQGDLVMEKHVEHEIGNVEAGGIGIQIVHGGSAATRGAHTCRTQKQPTVQQEAGRSELPFILKADAAESIVEKIASLQHGKSSPRDLAMPVRAAIEAGLMRRPSYSEYCGVRQWARINKSSFADYTSPDAAPYYDNAYKAIVEEMAIMAHS